MDFLKQASRTPTSADPETQKTAERLLAEIEREGEAAVRRINRELDGYSGEVVVAHELFRQARQTLPEQVKKDLRFARDRVRDFARRQRESILEFEAPLTDGLVAGQRLIPVTTAGCYVPGGRHAHAASAIMSICTAKAAGVSNVIAATPARGSQGVHPAILYAMEISGVSTTLVAGGVAGIAALAFGLFSGCPADIIAGPGNRFVSEAKRLLFGRIGIDLLAGPTENLIIADETANPHLIAGDLAAQAEHGVDSPVWLITTSLALGRRVLELLPDVIAELPEPARSTAAQAWSDLGEITLVSSREEACKVSDQYAPEHLQVQARDLDWWLDSLRNYGSLFLGEETTVAFGDKCSGPNHILPTRQGARHTGGLSVAKFIKVVTYQRMTQQGTRALAPVAARISRLEGMEAHARSAELRLEQYSGDEKPNHE